MKNRRITKSFLAVVFLYILAVIFVIIKAKTRLTYIEYTSVNETNDACVVITDPGQELVQEFYMPYDILHGISVQIGTFERDNNSYWRYSIVEKESQRTVYHGRFNGSTPEDMEYYLLETDKNIPLEKGKSYELHITADSVNSLTWLAFQSSAASDIEGVQMYVNGQPQEGSLCFRVYGGDFDPWWLGFYLLCVTYAALLCLRFLYLKKNNLTLREDRVFQGMAVIALVFLLLCSFATLDPHLDENDNIRGGMVIARGGVLYRDYVTQHTPVMYYLCAVFALLGAGSAEQFRLSYYFFEAVIWGMLYLRHTSFFGKKKMLLLSVLEVILIVSVIPNQGAQILSDGMQGICAVTLLLEFLRYVQDRKLGWDRCIIVSCCLWGSIGAAFVSVYALVWVVAAVGVLEFLDWRKNKFSAKECFDRYSPLLIAGLVPLMGAVLYFELNHSLGRAFRQFYSFNREVYPEYISGFGSTLAQPFIDAVQNLFGTIVDHFNTIISTSAHNVTILQLLVLVTALLGILLLFAKKKWLEGGVLLAFFCCSATRGYGFHGLAAWYVAVMIIVLMIDEFKEFLPKLKGPAIGLICIFLVSTYVTFVGKNLQYQQRSIVDMERKVIELTEEGDKVLLDAYYFDSIYLLYKDRYPANRAVYMLPWYMDWYEQDTIDDLRSQQPKVVVYNEEQEEWGHTYYANAFAAELKNTYVRVADDGGWAYNIWIPK